MLLAKSGNLSFTADVSVRHENFFSRHETATVPKVGVRWQPLDDSLTIRGSASKGFREPSLFELFAHACGSLLHTTNVLGRLRKLLRGRQLRLTLEANLCVRRAIGHRSAARLGASRRRHIGDDPKRKCYSKPL